MPEPIYTFVKEGFCTKYCHKKVVDGEIIYNVMLEQCANRPGPGPSRPRCSYATSTTHITTIERSLHNVLLTSGKIGHRLTLNGFTQNHAMKTVQTMF